MALPNESRSMNVPILLGAVITATIIGSGGWLVSTVQSFDRTIAAQSVKLDALMLADGYASEFREIVLVRLSEHGARISGIEREIGISAPVKQDEKRAMSTRRSRPSSSESSTPNLYPNP